MKAQEERHQSEMKVVKGEVSQVKDQLKDTKRQSDVRHHFVLGVLEHHASDINDLQRRATETETEVDEIKKKAAEQKAKRIAREKEMAHNNGKN